MRFVFTLFTFSILALASAKAQTVNTDPCAGKEGLELHLCWCVEKKTTDVNLCKEFEKTAKFQVLKSPIINTCNEAKEEFNRINTEFKNAGATGTTLPAMKACDKVLRETTGEINYNLVRTTPHCGRLLQSRDAKYIEEARKDADKKAQDAQEKLIEIRKEMTKDQAETQKEIASLQKDYQETKQKLEVELETAPLEEAASSLKHDQQFRQQAQTLAMAHVQKMETIRSHIAIEKMILLEEQKEIAKVEAECRAEARKLAREKVLQDEERKARNRFAVRSQNALFSSMNEGTPKQRAAIKRRRQMEICMQDVQKQIEIIQETSKVKIAETRAKAEVLEKEAALIQQQLSELADDAKRIRAIQDEKYALKIRSLIGQLDANNMATHRATEQLNQQSIVNSRQYAEEMERYQGELRQSQALIASLPSGGRGSLSDEAYKEFRDGMSSVIGISAIVNSSRKVCCESDEMKSRFASLCSGIESAQKNYRLPTGNQ